jgi:hypothetical protein
MLFFTLRDAQRPDDASTPLAAHDVAIDDAISQGSLDRLGALLAPDFRYTHTGGQRQSREDFLASIAARQTRSRRHLSDIEVDVHGRLAVTWGNLTISYTTGRANHYLRYVRVHRVADGAWQTLTHRTFEALDRRQAELAHLEQNC